MTKTHAPAPKTRLYVALDKEDGGKAVALIDATSAAAARSHLSRRKFVVRYAEQADIVNAVKAGVATETATSEDADT